MSSQKPLSAIQTAILTRAAERPDRAVLPLLLDVRLVGGARTKVLGALLTRGLIEEAATDLAAAAWRKSKPGQHVTLRLTDDGMIAAGVMPFRAGAEDEVGADVAAELPDADREAKPANPTVVPPPMAPGGKLSVILAALRSDDGASIDTLISLTGWLPHTTRAALTRLRQRGFPITRDTLDGRTTWRLAPPATDADHAA